MSDKSVAVKKTILRMVGVMTIAASFVHAQSPKTTAKPAPPTVRLPDEAAGINGIVEALISVYDQFDVVALGEMHDRRHDSDLRIALVRHPDFAKKVRTIVVEWGSTTEQATLDRYIRGENVSRAQFQQVWKKLSAGNIGDLVSEHSIYTDLFAAVREVNSRLPPAERIRVFGGDAGPTARDTGAVSILKEQALRKRGKALVVYGHAHFWRAVPGLGGISRRLDVDYPGRTFVVIPVGGPTDVRPEDNVAKPDYQKFDRALKTQARPVMVPLQRLPFRDFTAEDFLNGDIVRRSRGRWVGIFTASTLTLGQMADALVYFGKP
jgi:hypothetical protein